MTVVPEDEGGRPARSVVHQLAHNGKFSLCRVDIFTGRTHQLRVHLQSLGHPMLGDSLYAPPAVLALTPRLMLHAQEIGFPHPFTEKALCFAAPVSWSAANPYVSEARP